MIGELEKTMLTNIEFTGPLRLHNFRTTNNVKGEEEELSAYLKMRGLMPCTLYSRLCGLDMQDESWHQFFWGQDEAPANPSMDQIKFLAQAPEHIIVFSSGLGFTDENCTLRKFSLRPAFGKQFQTEFEIVLHPHTNANIGKLAHKQGHELEIEIKGCRNPDLFREEEEGEPGSE